MGCLNFVLSSLCWLGYGEVRDGVYILVLSLLCWLGEGVDVRKGGFRGLPSMC